MPNLKLVSAAALLIGTSALSPAHAGDDGDLGKWIEVGKSDGITVSRKEIPGDPVFAYKGEGVLNAPIGKLISVSRDVSRQKEWVNRLEMAKVLRELEPGHRVIYLKIDTPWPVSDRDFVIDSRMTVDRAKKTAVFDIHSVEDPLAPPDDCCVRGKVHFNHIEMRGLDGGRTAITAEAHVDPRGSIPKWIVNKIQKTFPHKSIEGLLKQVAKPDIPDFFATPSPLPSSGAALNPPRGDPEGARPQASP
jgi:hypothetical protein